MLRRQEVTIVITYDDATFADPANWDWNQVLEGGTVGGDLESNDVVLKGYGEPQEVV